MSKYKRLTEANITDLASMMGENIALSEAAERIGFDPSGIRKFILKYRTLEETKDQNKCGKKQICKLENAVCSDCYYGSKPTKCRHCKRNCTQNCRDFDPHPHCRRLKKFPYVCRGCPKALHCHLSKWRFNVEDIIERMKENRSEPRQGIRLSQEELAKLGRFLEPLIKEKGQTIDQIYLSHRHQMPVSKVTLLKYIDQKEVPGITNFDLRKRVKYPKKYGKRRPGEGKISKAYLQGRNYDCFQKATAENPFQEVVEMDTVETCLGGKGCILTLLFRKSNYMAAFYLKEKTQAEVTRVFRMIYGKLGPALYSKTFSVILTDNGTEFMHPASIEFDPETGEKLISIYYCEPGKSGQKGKLEKNHVELRKVLPKGTDFEKLTQQTLNLILRHVNSEPRKILNGNCPGTIAGAFLNEKVLGLNEYQLIKPDEVNLTPNLIG